MTMPILQLRGTEAERIVTHLRAPGEFVAEAGFESAAPRSQPVSSADRLNKMRPICRAHQAIASDCCQLPNKVTSRNPLGTWEKWIVVSNPSKGSAVQVPLAAVKSSRRTVMAHMLKAQLPRASLCAHTA